jgi:hypothetical protein
MNREEVLEIIARAKTAGSVPNLRDADLLGANLHGANLQCVDLQGADLRGADLRGANLQYSSLDLSAWPLWRGGTGATLDRRTSLQLIYHTFNNNHTDPEILEAMEPLRRLAQEFIDNHRSDAPELRGGK